MISLHVYLTPKEGREKDLDSAVQQGWLQAMSEQPGFLAAAVVRPYDDMDLEALDAIKPASALEAVSFWRSEAERLEWVARPIHDEVFNKVIDAAEGVSYTLQNVEGSWGL
jgi:heme-degrading monooxygenase HmoA